MNFEDLHFLFTNCTHNRGIVRLDFDEASYLYKLVRVLNKKQEDPIEVIEIGTYKGGSTVLLAAAGAHVTSIDNYSSKTFVEYDYDPIEDVKKLISDSKLNANIKLIKADSRNYKNADMECDILFIDGDHSYDGVKSDYYKWIHTLKEKGHLIFHDSCIAREKATGVEGVMKFMKEIPYRKFHQVGSITHFVKINND